MRRLAAMIVPKSVVRRALLFTTLALLLLPGCALLSWRQAPPAHTGIVGHVTMSGGPAPGISRPYPQSRIEVRNAAGQPVVSVKPKADGSYSLALAPGRYHVTAVPTTGNLWFVPQTVTVRRGHYFVVDLDAPVP